MAILDRFDIKGRSAFVTGAASGIGLAYAEAMAEAGASVTLTDIDADGAKEFLDGWGRPIAFSRWPAGFDAATIDRSQPDPLDVMRVTAAVTSPFAAASDWAMAPLIYSAGPDESLNDPLGSASGYGRQNPGPSWLSGLPATPISSTCQNNPNGAVTNAEAASDNVSNYDLLRK